MKQAFSSLEKVNPLRPLKLVVSKPSRNSTFTNNHKTQRQILQSSKMDAELLELQKQFESAQQAKSSVRLSDRNVVELVQKLHDLKLFDFDLLHTVSGKEYITPDQLRREIEVEIKRSGRISFIDLSEVIGVDLYHVERIGKEIVKNDASLMIVNGELISNSYWDLAAEEIDEKLQECSQIALAEIAAHLHIGSELVIQILGPRIGKDIKGRLEGGQLYTPAYVSRICSMVRGASRGLTVPTNLALVWNSLQQILQEIDGANGVSVEAAFFHSQFNRLVKDGEILGTLRAGVQWTPAVFAHAQRESVESFYSQNSYISYDVLHKLAIPQPKQYLQSGYSEGIPLEGVFVHPSLLEMLDAAIEDAIEHGNWIDSLSVLPAYVGGQDMTKILSLCPFFQKAIKSSKAIVFGESCIFSTSYIKDIFDQMEKEMDMLSFTNLSMQGHTETHSSYESKSGINSGNYFDMKDKGENEGNSKSTPEKGSKKKRGKNSGSSTIGLSETDPEENIPSKSKKNQRRSKDTTHIHAGDSKHGNRRGSDKPKENTNIPSEEWTTERILAIAPDLGEFFDTENPKSVVKHLTNHLRPMLHDSWKKKRNTVLMENSERRRQSFDNLQKQMDEAFLELQLYEKSLVLFEDDSSTSAILHKHLLKTMATPIFDKLILTLVEDNKLNSGAEVSESESLDTESLNSANRMSLAKSLRGALSVKALTAVEALEGKRVDIFIEVVKEIVEECGLLLKKLDKKLERTLLHSYRKDLTTQVSAETDPVALLPKVVALLYLQVYNKALQAPGRAISVAVSRLKEKLPESTYQILVEYHKATVTLLALQVAATEDEEDCTSDRILSKKELLDEKMSELKSLVLT